MNLYIMLINNALYVHGLSGKYGHNNKYSSGLLFVPIEHMWGEKGASEWLVGCNEEIPIFIMVEVEKPRVGSASIRR